MLKNKLKTFKLILVRHGESVANLQSELIGGRSPEAKLSPKGEQQAINLGKHFLKIGQKLDVIYSSPLVRCEQTAKLCLKMFDFNTDNSHFAKGCELNEREISQKSLPKSPKTIIPPIILDDRLIEFSQGDWEGKLRSEIYTLEAQNLINKQKTWFKPPLGESLRMLKNRATNFLETEIMNKFWQNNLENNLEINLNRNLENGKLETQKVANNSKAKNENQILQNQIEIESSNQETEQKETEQKVIAIFGHGMWIKVLLMEILGLDQIITVNLQIDNCSLTELEFGDFGWRLCSFNYVLENGI